MNGLTTVTTKGQVTIPEEVRQLLQIDIGDRVFFPEIYPLRKTAVMKVVSQKVADRLYGCLKSPIRENDYLKVRRQAGKLLLKKYQIKTK